MQLAGKFSGNFVQRSFLAPFLKEMDFSKNLYYMSTIQNLPLHGLQTFSFMIKNPSCLCSATLVYLSSLDAYIETIHLAFIYMEKKKDVKLVHGQRTR